MFKTSWRRPKTSIAVQNSFPRQSQTAENEFVRRLKLCAERQSIETQVVDCSAEVAATGADFLLSLHEVSPKLTPTVTIGAMWNPPSGIRHDPVRRDFVASFDGYLSASPSVTRFITDQIAPFAGLSKPIADFRFFPTSPRGIAHATSYDSLAYLGVHWDGARHGAFLDQLTREGLLTVYGPESAWHHAGSAYRGGIPFDGTSVIRRLAEHGIVLCLHRDPHVADDTPSMRLFEAASAGCLILADAIPFAAETFGDTIFVLPDHEGRVEFVREKLAWARANPGRARDMALASRAIFEAQCSLDVLLPKLVSFGKTTRDRYASPGSRRWLLRRPDRIDVICDLRTSDEFGLADAIAVANAQTYDSIRVLALRSEGGHRPAEPKIQPRRGVRVTELVMLPQQSAWSAPTLVPTPSPLLASLNLGTTWAPWHLDSLARALQSTPESSIAFSSTVVSVTEGTVPDPPNFSGAAEKLVSENSVLVATDYGGHLPMNRPGQTTELLTRSDWLTRTRHLSDVARPGAESGSDRKRSIIQTGLVTCFVHQKTAVGLRPITFS